MKHSLALVCALTALLTSSCLQDRYRIDMRVAGEGYERRLEWTQPGQILGTAEDDGEPQEPPLGALDEDEARRLEGLYGTRLDSGENVFAASGIFAGATPADVGGAGSMCSLASELGTLWVYSERFRGQDDPLTQIQRQNEASALFASLVREWLASELDGAPGWERLAAFVDERLERDLCNVLMFVYVECAARPTPPQAFELAANADGAETRESDLAARILRYLDERGWFGPGEFEWFHADMALGSAISEDTFGPELLNWLRGLCERQLGPQSVGSLDFLSSPEAIAASWSEHLRRSDWIEDQLRPWMLANYHPGELDFRAETEFQDGQDPGAWPAVLLWLVPPVRFLSDFDEVLVYLHLDQPPLWTNGRWDSEQGAVVFGAVLDESAEVARSYPTLASAVWVRPDEQRQTALFGAPLLDASHLAHYCRWYAQLDRERREQWDALLSHLDGTPQALAEVASFRFEDAPEKAPTGVRLICGEED